MSHQPDHSPGLADSHRSRPARSHVREDGLSHDRRHHPDPRGPDRQLPRRARRGLPRARSIWRSSRRRRSRRPASSCAAISPRGQPQLVAVEGGQVVGWCDITPMQRPTMQHCGVLGMALFPRGAGVGSANAYPADAGRRPRLRLFAGGADGPARQRPRQALYRNVGFETEGTKAARGAGRWSILRPGRDGAAVRCGVGPSGSDAMASG